MRLFAACLSCLCVAAADAPRARSAGPQLRRYDTPYYVVRTDLPPDGAAEAVVRMAKLGDELRRRTRALGFRGRIQERLPFYLYARHADYVAAAEAPPESAGVFLGDRLVAAAADPRGSSAWHVIQHEAFHQFAAATPGTEMPPWLNEGLGEYFGEALFTGDGYVTGAVPAWRLKRVRRSMEAGAFQPLADFAATSQEQWNREMTLARYDHAWSLVQFLLHADRGKHRQRVARYVEALGSAKPPAAAWDAAFSGLTGMEQEWKRYWLGLPDAGTPSVSDEATVATLTSFLARAVAAGQRFDSFDAFTRAARAGTLRSHREDWLPPSLLLRALDSLPKGARLSIQGRAAGTTLLAQFPDRSAWAGTFALIDDRVAAVTVAPAQLVPLNPEP